jgi:hypothetical protein
MILNQLVSVADQSMYFDLFIDIEYPIYDYLVMIRHHQEIMIDMMMILKRTILLLVHLLF